MDFRAEFLFSLPLLLCYCLSVCRRNIAILYTLWEVNYGRDKSKWSVSVHIIIRVRVYHWESGVSTSEQEKECRVNRSSKRPCGSLEMARQLKFWRSTRILYPSHNCIWWDYDNLDRALLRCGWGPYMILLNIISYIFLANRMIILFQVHNCILLTYTYIVISCMWLYELRQGQGEGENFRVISLSWNVNTWLCVHVIHPPHNQQPN